MRSSSVRNVTDQTVTLDASSPELHNPEQPGFVGDNPNLEQTLTAASRELGSTAETATQFKPSTDDSQCLQKHKDGWFLASHCRNADESRFYFETWPPPARMKARSACTLASGTPL